MSSTSEYAALMLFDPLGSDGDMTGSTFVENLAGAASTSNMQIIDAFLKQKASFIVKTSAEWAVDTTVLRANDFGGASDTGEVRRGDGVHTWKELSTFDPGNVSGKIDKVPSATNGNLASLTADGSVADSGKKAADFAAPAISTTATLPVAGWSDKSQTVTVTGVTTTNNILVMPQKASSEDYYTAEVEAIVQATDSLTFVCETVPTAALIVDIIILG